MINIVHVESFSKHSHISSSCFAGVINSESPLLCWVNYAVFYLTL